jgi:hypothetical protein
VALPHFAARLDWGTRAHYIGTIGTEVVKVKKLLLFVLAGFVAALRLAGQSASLVGEKELITRIGVGGRPTDVAFLSSEQGMTSPGAPLLDDEARIWFISASERTAIVITKGVIKAVPFSPDLANAPIPSAGTPGKSQQGFFGFSDPPADNGWLPLKEQSRTGGRAGQRALFMPWGLALEFFDFEDNVDVASIQYDPMRFSMTSAVQRKYTFRNLEETRTWLPTQTGGFTLGDDGLLYRNGLLYSPKRPKETSGQVTYLGRLASGHAVWYGVNSAQEKKFYFCDPSGTVETTMTIRNPNGDYYEYGIGPWGEVYGLFPTSPILGEESPQLKNANWQNGTADLVVIRNHLRDYGRLSDGGVRLRKEPSTTAEVLGTFPAKTGFRILEKGTKVETIGGQKNVWQKVRLLDGKEGWFFGAFIQNLYDGPNGKQPPWPNVADW